MQTPDRINVQRFTQKFYSQEGGGNVGKIKMKKQTQITTAKKKQRKFNHEEKRWRC